LTNLGIGLLEGLGDKQETVPDPDQLTDGESAVQLLAVEKSLKARGTCSLLIN